MIFSASFAAQREKRKQSVTKTPASPVWLFGTCTQDTVLLRCVVAPLRELLFGGNQLYLRIPHYTR